MKQTRFLFFFLTAAVIALSVAVATPSTASAAGDLPHKTYIPMIGMGNSQATPPVDQFVSLDAFVEQVADGAAGVVRGVYVSDLLALKVVQQPSTDPYYISGRDGEATQFQLAALTGSTGLLAHNYLSGKKFFDLQDGQEVTLVYGDGALKTYVIRTFNRYQVLDSNNPSSNFIDLSNGNEMTASEVFAANYMGDEHVTFQTCIKQDGNSSWGRLFIIAEPKME